MTDSKSLRTQLLLGELKEVLRLDPNNAPALCRIARDLIGLGAEREARKCYRAAVDALRRAAHLGDVQRALDFEALVYETFVKAIESEDHYRQCFAQWKDHLAALGRRIHELHIPAEIDSSRIAFLLQVGAFLAHAEVLLKMLESRPRSGGDRRESRVYVVDRYDPAFVARCRAADVEVVAAIDALGNTSSWAARFHWLKQRFREDGIGTCVWVSVPTMAAFALSMRLAPVQIFWAMRFHPISGPEIDGYITWGAPGEQVQHHGDQEWQVVPMPLALDDSPVPHVEVERLRTRFPQPVLLGTLARAEKINSRPYLLAVARILAANPEAGFLWTGRSEHSGITDFFQAAGVGQRCHFIGWVDTRQYAAALDVFLETFPVGSGVTSLQAFAAGVPLLSYLDPQTIFGTYYWQDFTSRFASGAEPQDRRLRAPDEFPILCASDAEEYVALAGRLIGDPAWRKNIGEKGRAFYLEELNRNTTYAEHFFATIQRIADAKRGRSSSSPSGAPACNP